MEWQGQLPDNFVHIVGVCKRDADATQLRAGLQVLNFSLVVPDPFSDRDVYIDCVAMGDAVDALEGFVTGGELLCVIGRLTFRSWTDANGVQRSGKVVYVDKVYDQEDMEAENEHQQG